jgi:hypothetical protein
MSRRRRKSRASPTPLTTLAFDPFWWGLALWQRLDRQGIDGQLYPVCLALGAEWLAGHQAAVEAVIEQLIAEHGDRAGLDDLIGVLGPTLAAWGRRRGLPVADLETPCYLPAALVPPFGAILVAFCHRGPPSSEGPCAATTRLIDRLGHSLQMSSGGMMMPSGLQSLAGTHPLSGVGYPHMPLSFHMQPRAQK